MYWSNWGTLELSSTSTSTTSSDMPEMMHALILAVKPIAGAAITPHLYHGLHSSPHQTCDWAGAKFLDHLMQIFV